MRKFFAALASMGLGLGGLLVAPAEADAAFDVYATPGYHTYNGRQWHTTCSKYSATITRCRTEIKSTYVVYSSGRYVTKTGYVFNNLTYLASPRAGWANNNLGKSAEWTTADGRDWYTTCDTPTTGSNGCRSYIWSTYIAKTATGYKNVSGWVFNNQVRFTDDVYATYRGTGSTVITLPTGVTEAYVTATFTMPDEWDSFSVTGLASDNSEVDYPIYAMDARTSAGITGWNEDVRKLQVDATGSWTITVKPFTAAPKLTASASGTGSQTFWYHGGARSAVIRHTSENYFGVDQETADDWKLLVNEVGPYSGTVALLAGPALITVDADGAWSITLA